MDYLKKMLSMQIARAQLGPKLRVVLLQKMTDCIGHHFIHVNGNALHLLPA
jgi:hypothetical protein